MHALETAVNFADRAVRRAQKNLSEDRSLTVNVTNGSQSPLKLKGKYVNAGVCEADFEELSPNQTGQLQWTSAKGSFMSKGVTGCHHAGAVEFVLDGLLDETGERRSERLIIGEAMPMGQSMGKASRFGLEFVDKERSLQNFYSSLPAEFLGTFGTRNRVNGKNLSAHVHVISAKSPAEVDVTIVDDESVVFLTDVESFAQLRFLEFCLQCHRDRIIEAFFTAEVDAVTHTIERASFVDRAFAMDLLVCMFISSDLLPVDLAEKSALLETWRAARPAPLQQAFADCDDAHCCAEYSAYADLAEKEDELAAYVVAARRLIIACNLQSARSMRDVIENFKNSNAHGGDLHVTVPHLSAQQVSRMKRLGARGSISSTSASFLLDRLGDSAEDVASSGGEDSPETGGYKTSSRYSLGSQRLSSRGSLLGGLGSDDPPSGEDLEELHRLLMRHCIETSSKYAKRRVALLRDLAELMPSQDAKSGFAHYRRWIGLAHRCFVANETSDNADTMVRFEAFNQDVFGNIVENTDALLEQMLSSIGVEAPPFKALSTNSKSGEYFFMAQDKRFILKTVSRKEAVVLSNMMPAYLNHIQSLPRSLIVRFAGLFGIQMSTFSMFFMVMHSVFDPEHLPDVTFDLKGSLQSREKKEGESVGKDKDWLNKTMRLAIPRDLRRELCALHEQDCKLLMSRRLMDYSLLVGVHNLPPDAQGGQGWRSGGGSIYSSDGKAIYFIGLIDFSIKYSLKKQGENLVKVACGHGETASCVSPEAYALRQVRFLRTSVVDELPSQDDYGSLGMLQVDVKRAKDLVAADWTFTSDPYVVVTVGLVRRQTHAVPKTCNPEWNSTLYLPVNESHFHAQVDIAVWDEDQQRALRGNDDFLGRLQVPLADIMSGEIHFVGKPLVDARKGLLTLSLRYHAGPSSFGAEPSTVSI
eukprot:TRINITY_DN21868_c0_g1_i1.p1 TRINITY_DN21868_c0_g1~~TRINITY_DN21868_c0_g1_i1.p1  ORF type:complete len:925 (+),score=195.40 TRINITY_DN21868_c0_g1_i1:81-2855(+)